MLSIINVTISDNPPDDAPEWMIRWTGYINKWWFALIFIFGVPGNIMSLLVTLKKDNRRISTCIYMAALALVDSGVIIVSSCQITLVVYGWAREVQESLAFLSYVWYCANTFAVSSGLFLAEMSIDRAIAVTFPMKAATICTASRATKVIVFTFVFECIIQSLEFPMYKLPDPPNGLMLRELPPNLKWAVTVFNMYLVIFGTILPFAILMISNTIILLSTQRAAVERKKLSGEQKKDAKGANLTKMLFLTSMAFLFCSCPKRVWETVAGAHYDVRIGYWSARYWFEFWIVTELWMCNFGVNFYMYFLGGGRKFRNDARTVWTRAYWRKR